MTQDSLPMDCEFERWSRIYSGSSYYYGYEPGPVARRALRYHRPLLAQGCRALDVGSGEGQDLLYLAQSGYCATGLEWTPAGVDKTRKLLAKARVQAEVLQLNLREWLPASTYDLVLAVNVLQFLGRDAPQTLRTIMAATGPGGVLGLSVFSREDAATPACQGTIFRWTLEEILEEFEGWQMYEAARLWQWGPDGPQPFVTLIAGRI